MAVAAALITSVLSDRLASCHLQDWGPSRGSGSGAGDARRHVTTHLITPRRQKQQQQRRTKVAKRWRCLWERESRPAGGNERVVVLLSGMREVFIYAQVPRRARGGRLVLNRHTLECNVHLYRESPAFRPVARCQLTLCINARLNDLH